MNRVLGGLIKIIFVGKLIEKIFLILAISLIWASFTNSNIILFILSIIFLVGLGGMKK